MLLSTAETPTTHPSVPVRALSAVMCNTTPSAPNEGCTDKAVAAVRNSKARPLLLAADQEKRSSTAANPSTCAGVIHDSREAWKDVSDVAASNKQIAEAKESDWSMSSAHVVPPRELPPYGARPRSSGGCTYIIIAENGHPSAVGSRSRLFQDTPAGTAPAACAGAMHCTPPALAGADWTGKVDPNLQNAWSDAEEDIHVTVPPSTEAVD